MAPLRHGHRGAVASAERAGKIGHGTARITKAYGNPVMNDTFLQPWSNETLCSIFLFGSRSRNLQALFGQQRQALQERVAAVGLKRTRQLFASLIQAGMISGPLGLDFTPLQFARYATSPADILLDAEVKKALELLVFPVDVLIEGSSAAAHAMWSRDQPARRASVQIAPDLTGSSRLDAGLVQNLHEDGLASVRDWSEWGLDLNALAAQVERAMRGPNQMADMSRRSAGAAARHGRTKAGLANMTNCCLNSRAHLSALNPLLNNPRLARILRSYLGGTVRYDGSTILNVTSSASTRNYASALWHHDRCGRRLKLFIFLHDVGLDGRPTVIAARSHNMLYYTYGNPWQLLSRYSESWVQSRYRVMPMTGAKGGGFLFDTNSLHKGEIHGHKSRLTVILEFHGHGKVHQLHKHNNPCPSSGSKRSPNGVHGMPGFPEYPVEAYGPLKPYEYSAQQIKWPIADLSGYL